MTTMKTDDTDEEEGKELWIGTDEEERPEGRIYQYMYETNRNE